MRFVFPICIFLSLVCVFVGQPALCQADTPAPAAARAKLPTKHAYQQTLRAYLGTLKEKDFDHAVTEVLTVSEKELSLDEQYRLFIMTMMHQPLIGWKRGVPAVNATSKLFLLSNIEGPIAPPESDEPATPPVIADDDYTPVPIPEPKGIIVPPVWPETLIAFTQWDYPGNPYYDNHGLKMRAFVTAVVKMVMLDDYFENNPESHQPDVNGYKLACFGSTYLGVKDLLPPNVQQAFEAGLLKLGKEMITWDIKGESPNRDMSAPLGFWYVVKATGDQEFAQAAESYAKQMMTDPHYFHPAGYWVERGGGPDFGFGGGANFYAVWAALATDWPFAKETVEKAYRLRAHLTLPDPDGFLNGPSHFNSRLGSPASADQWHWDGARDQAALMVTDEAAPFIKIPMAEQLNEAAGNRVSWFNFQIRQNPVRPDLKGRKSSPRTGYWSNEDLRGRTWTWRMWQTYNFPIGINIGHEFYQPNSYAHLKKLIEEDSPLLKTPMERGEIFTRNFEDAFIVTRQAKYGAILHTGAVGSQAEDDKLPMYPGPLGFGGGQLSAFWTPETGSVILGRRIAMRYDTNYDTLETWRKWPIHAISGCTKSGTVFTSARNTQPHISIGRYDEQWRVGVVGNLPAVEFEQEGKLKEPIRYDRALTIGSDFVHVQSVVTNLGEVPIAELYETLPVFLREAKRQPDADPTKIEFEVDGSLKPATAEYQEGVTAVLLTRFDGAVRVTFDRPRRVKLSPEDWADTYLTRATCRNVMIDLLENEDQPQLLKQTTINYRIEPVGKLAK